MITTSITDPEPSGKSNASTYKWKALITVALSTTMGTMDMSVTNIAPAHPEPYLRCQADQCDVGSGGLHSGQQPP